MTKSTDAIDLALLPHATEVQQRYIHAVNAAGSISGAARVLGVNKKTILVALAGVRQKAAMAGLAPDHNMVHTAPDPFVVKGVSTLFDDQGQVRMQWVKTKLDQARAAETIKTFVDHLVQDARGLSPIIAAPAYVDSDLLVVYPMGDPHFGMFAWAAEAGDDFDLKIAEQLTCAAIDRLVSSAPAAKTAIILELGDFFHTDNSNNQTLRSGNALDVDTRWAKVMQVGLRAMVHCVKRALQKHETVIVRIVKGNHDEHSSFALALALDAYFSLDPRVTIDLHPAVFWYYKFGQVLIGSTHGDTCKMRDLPAVMAADRAKDWGDTTQRYWYVGHVHHDEVQEYPGVKCESFRTLAARDAWHNGQGYRAGRDMRAIVHHRKYGEIERHRCDIAMLQAAA